VNPANCYTLLVGDRYGDGMVNGAYWQLYWNGDLKFDVGAGRPSGNFGNSMSADIGNGCAGDATATADLGVKASMTMDSQSVNSKKASIAQCDKYGNVDEEDDK
jgi:hypothetical protein